MSWHSLDAIAANSAVPLFGPECGRACDHRAHHGQAREKVWRIVHARQIVCRTQTRPLEAIMTSLNPVGLSDQARVLHSAGLLNLRDNTAPALHGATRRSELTALSHRLARLAGLGDFDDAGEVAATVAFAATRCARLATATGPCDRFAVEAGGDGLARDAPVLVATGPLGATGLLAFAAAFLMVMLGGGLLDRAQARESREHAARSQAKSAPGPGIEADVLHGELLRELCYQERLGAARRGMMARLPDNQRNVGSSEARSMPAWWRVGRGRARPEGDR